MAIDNPSQAPTQGPTDAGLTARVLSSALLPVDTAPYSKPVLAWLYLPKNPIASAWTVAERCAVEKDEPENYGEFRRTVGCWWANGMYYPAGYVRGWQPLPTPPTNPKGAA